MTPAENDLFSLRNKTFLITGGTRGIGQAITLRFARAGAKVSRLGVEIAELRAIDCEDVEGWQCGGHVFKGSGGNGIGRMP